MVSDSKKKRLEAKAAKAAAKGEKIERVKSSASLKQAASVADSLASQMEDGTLPDCFRDETWSFCVVLRRFGCIAACPHRPSPEGGRAAR